MHRIALALVLLVAPATALAAAPPAGTWQRLPAAPFAVEAPTSVWTGSRLLVFGRMRSRTRSVNAAEAYDPVAHTWRRLAPPPGRTDDLGRAEALWTGKEMLVWGTTSNLAYDPQTNRWRTLPRSLPFGIVVWTGREAIGWGGGCCGDAWSNGAAYEPATGAWRTLARSPLAPSQRPVGAWTGRELILFVSTLDPDGKPWPARLARAAAYDPAADAWRRIAAPPASGGSAVWDGRELLVVGAGADARSAFAYYPTANRWRRLASLPSRRNGASAVWAGQRLLLWGGPNRTGLSYDPAADRWTALPAAPLPARDGATVAWTGRALIVWGGEIGTPAGTSIPPRQLADGAAFTPGR